MNLLTSRDHALRIAVWSVMGTEAVAFAALVAARAPALRHGPTVAGLAFALAVAAALSGGSALLAGALRRACANRTQEATRMLSVAALLGVVALGLELSASRVSASRDPIGLITAGLHAAHVAAAVALAMWVRALVQLGRVRRRQYDVLRLVGTYWMFVSIVWVAVWPVFVAVSA